MTQLDTQPAPGSAPGDEPEPTKHIVSYPRFLWRSLVLATDGSWKFYAWMILLTAISLVGANAWAVQVRDGMATTGMTDHVSWGMYIANFTFMVGVAAGAVMVVIPAYLYRDSNMRNVVIIGELLAISAITMCLLFVTVDLGRPDRFIHMVPPLGRFNFPMSMLTWDVIVLNGYLLINLHICGYTLYSRYLNRPMNPKWYLPFVYVSIVWAISIHTVTAFLYCGLGGRPFWNTALLAPRFLSSAFVAGPCFIVIAMLVIRRIGHYQINRSAIHTLVRIIRVAILVSLLMVISEVFTEFYTGGHHTASAQYLYFGLHGKTALVPWIWTSIALTIIAAIVFLVPRVWLKPGALAVACVFAFVGLWIEKGIGLIVPAFVPSTLGEVVEYTPSLTEWKITVGIWALGLMVFTVALKVAVPILTGQATHAGSEAPATP